VLNDEQLAETKRRRRTRDLRRNYYLQHHIDLKRPVPAACHWLLPWGWWQYPGKLRGLRQITGGNPPRSKSTILGWIKKNDAPLDVMRRLADEIGAQARQGLEIEDALRVKIAEKESRRRRAS
jgi:hypothetical protein